MSDRPNRVYACLRQFQRQNRYAPTVRELAEMSGLSQGTVTNVLHYLAGSNAIVRRRYIPRGSYIPTEPHQFRGEL